MNFFIVIILYEEWLVNERECLGVTLFANFFSGEYTGSDKKS
jgi:hypothetical protein